MTDKYSAAEDVLPVARTLLQATGWDGVTRALMLAGKQLPVLAESKRQPENLVPGCDSEVWIDSKCCEGKQLYCAYSPSKIIRGVLSVLLEKANTMSEEEVATFKFDDYLTRLGLQQHLSQSRAYGIRKVIARLHALAAVQC
ncbi:SufE family protein [Alteromonas pelagimontana]|uniref:SufE family protein n=2 Tax=Alteromonas pelagimontana TaxID=1858656 RepID=A0A6M4MHY2_9ALTE|nr:SufE family protein [Alteromonas pelagimontana]